MITELTAASVYAEIMMMRQVDKRAVLVVEGIEDLGILDPQLDGRVCRTQAIGGRPAALQLSDLVAQNSELAVLILVDRDNSPQSEVSSWPECVVATDHHDLLADILVACPQLLSNVLANFADRQAIERYDLEGADSMLTHVVDVIRPITVLRSVSVSRGLGLRVSKFPFHEFVRVGRDERLAFVLGVVSRRGGPLPLTVDELSAVIVTEQVSLSLVARWSSHDFVAAFAAIIRLRLNGNTSDVGAKSLERTMRTAVSTACISKTTVYKSVARWGRERGLVIWRHGLAGVN